MRCRTLCFVTYLLFLGTILTLFFAPPLTLRGEKSVIPEDLQFDCPPITPCGGVKSLSELGFDDEWSNTPIVREPGDDAPFDRVVKICIVYLIHRHKREREKSFSWTFHKEKHIYEFVHVYSKNDDYPKDNRKGYIIFPEFADYDTILKKVWFGFSYFRDHNCDYIMKMDDDATVDWLTFSYVLTEGKVNPSTWIGRYEKGGRKCDMNPGSKWHGIPFAKYTGRDTYTDFMYGQFYGFGKSLYECVVKDIDERVAKEANAKHKFVGLHLEDVGMAYIVHQCKGMEGFAMRRFDGLYYGDYLANINAISWVGPFLEHKKTPERETSSPLWMTI